HLSLPLRLRPPPTSPLFPYTTLFRSIVAVARSPIGRAFKGSLRDLRPDDLAASIVRTALDKVPQLDPADIDDLMLGCGLPGGERSEEHTSELQSRFDLVCRLLLEKKK